MVYFDGRFVPDREEKPTAFRVPLLLASFLSALLAMFWLVGCSVTARSVGSHDPAIDIARANAEAEKARAAAQTAMMNALVAALGRLAAPSPSPTPPALCVSSDSVTVVPCQEVVR